MPEMLSIEDKYKNLEAVYGKNALIFAKKILAFFAAGRGDDSRLYNSILERYKEGDIVVYDDKIKPDLAEKILLKPAIRPVYNIDYTSNAAFGFINEKGEAIFAEIPFSLYQWSGELNSLTTAILDIGKSYHDNLIADQTKRHLANNEFSLIDAFEIVNRLSDKIGATKTT